MLYNQLAPQTPRVVEERRELLGTVAEGGGRSPQGLSTIQRFLAGAIPDFGRTTLPPTNMEVENNLHLHEQGR